MKVEMHFITVKKKLVASWWRIGEPTLAPVNQKLPKILCVCTLKILFQNFQKICEDEKKFFFEHPNFLKIFGKEF